jgi:hypothetical protein
MELRQLTDQELLSRLRGLAAQERESTADVVEHLAELDRRGTVADTGYPTLFEYCLRGLRYSEAATFLRIRAARAARAHPRVISDLRSGATHLDAVMRLYPHLTKDNGDRLLDLVSGASKREVLSLVAGLSPQPPPERDVVRVVAVSSSASIDGVPEVIPPVTRVRITFSADPEVRDMLDRLKGLRRHRFPEGRIEDLIKESVGIALEHFLPKRLSKAAPVVERSRSRWVSKAVKAAVWQRDGGRCTFVAEDGRRCGSREFLEYDHIHPWSQGGKTEVANLRLLCRPHNQRLARKLFGPPPKLLRPDAPA